MVAAAAPLLLLSSTAAVGTGRFIISTAKEDHGVWYYEQQPNMTLFFIDINWPQPWHGRCGEAAVKPLLQPVSEAGMWGLTGRLLGGSGSPCSPPCVHFRCAQLPGPLPPAPPITPPSPTSLPVDSWADKYYRNWTYYSDWVIRPSCLDPSTCGRVKRNFTDIAQAWRVPGDKQWSMTYTFFDGEGYQTALAHSSDLLKWDQSPGTVFSPRVERPPLEWTAQPGDFDYGGAGEFTAAA